MSLFGIPFLLGSIIFWSIALMAIAGKVEVTFNKQGGSVFTGLGSIGLSKKFTWDEISSVKEIQIQMRYPGNQGSAIALEGKRRITFGRGLNQSRRYYVYKACKNMVNKVNQQG